MTNFKHTIAAASLMLFAGSATAVPINGSIGFTGSFDIYDDDTAAIVNSFTVGDEILIGLDAAVTGTVTGSFAAEGIMAGDSVSHSDILYNPAGAITDLWSIGSFTFDLTNMSVDYITANSIVISGGGTISSTDLDLDDSVGNWLFSANNIGANFTWSSSTDVPAPAITLLLGMGLLGFAASRKLRA